MTTLPYLRLAARNLRRHTRRSLITGLSIALGLALFILSVDFAEGVYADMIDSGVGMMAGHVVVQGRGYQEEPSLDRLVPDASRVAERLQAVAPRGVVVKRLFLDGLLSAPRGSAGVSVTASDPATEAHLGDLDEHIVAGRYLGRDASDIVIGTTLAETLDVRVGDKVVLLVQYQGELMSQLFRVCGLFQTGSEELDGFFAQVSLDAALSALELEDRASQVSLHLPDIDDTDDVTAQARRALESERLEVLPWYEALPELAGYVAADRAGNYAFLLVIALIVAIGILNTMMMSVLERTKELGVLLALGLPPLGVAALILVEAALLATLAAAAGFALGNGVSLWLARAGVDLSSLYGEGLSVAGVALETRVNPDVDPWRSLIFAALALVVAVAAALWPVARAARLEPVAAMQER